MATNYYENNFFCLEEFILEPRPLSLRGNLKMTLTLTIKHFFTLEQLQSYIFIHCNPGKAPGDLIPTIY